MPTRVYALTPGEAKDNNNVATVTFPLSSRKAIFLFDYKATQSFISTAYAKFCAIEAEVSSNSLTVSIPTGKQLYVVRFFVGVQSPLKGG